jgi:hypothetical protein
MKCSSFLMLSLLLFGNLGCNGSSSPTTPAPAALPITQPAAPTPIPTAPVPSPGNITGAFRLSPAQGSGGVVTLSLGGSLKVNAGHFTDSDPTASLHLYVEWGDGQVGNTDCGPCILEHFYKSPGTFNLIASIGDGRTSFNHKFSVEVSPAQFCHSIVAASNGTCSATAVTCPTGATQFCEAVPIVATNSSHALDACTACFGPGKCLSSPPAIVGGTPQNAYFFGAGSCFCGGSTPVPLAGDNTSTSCGIVGRWAP